MSVYRTIGPLVAFYLGPVDKTLLLVVFEQIFNVTGEMQLQVHIFNRISESIFLSRLINIHAY